MVNQVPLKKRASCRACVKSKVKCTGGERCERCVKRNAMCIYDAEKKRGRRTKAHIQQLKEEEEAKKLKVSRSRH